MDETVVLLPSLVSQTLSILEFLEFFANTNSASFHDYASIWPGHIHKDKRHQTESSSTPMVTSTSPSSALIEHNPDDSQLSPRSRG